MLRTAGRKLGPWLQEELRSERLLPGLSAGVLMGITEIIVALSLGSLMLVERLAATTRTLGAVLR